MRNRVERLRVWLVGSAIFLILVIAAFIGYARIMSRLQHVKVPSKLGLNIVRDAGGWTLSRSKGSKTLYTVRATRWDQGTNGKVALHDVSMLLYGQDGNRRDRIYGDEFEYDQKEGVVRALGVVHMDLQAAAAGTPPGTDVAENSSAKVLHVTTSGLVYLEKLGVAATGEDIEFETGAMKGHAHGADFTSDTGMLMLQSAVSMSGVAAGRPVEVTAATAQLDDRNHEAFLTRAKYVSQDRTAAADKATLYLRPIGDSLERVDAHGDVTLTGNGGTVVSQRAQVELNATSQPKSAVLTGGVRYSADEPLRQATGQANEATLTFDAEATPQPEHAVFTGAVHMTERVRAKNAPQEAWSVRDLIAANVDAVLAPGAAVQGKAGQPQLRTVHATGSARMTLVDAPGVAGGKGQTELSADDLKAVLKAADDGKQPELDTIAGRGHTVLRQVNVAGIEQTSTGDTLDARFRVGKSDSRAPSKRESTERLQETLWSALQQGHVVLTQRTPAKAGAEPAVERATAQRAAYDGDQDRVTLTGGVQVSDAGSVLWASQVALDHATGDSVATGGVKVDYDSAQAGAGKSPRQNAEPSHILADRAELEHATSVATFYGTSKPVRLWQGGSQVQAPVIEVSREQKRLIARGAAATGWSGAQQAAQVHTVLMSTGGSGTTGAAAGKGTPVGCAATPGGTASAGGAAGEPQVVRIASGGLIYSGILRQADFTGGVRADTTDSTIRANQATAFLDRATAADQSAAKSDVAAAPSLAGNLDRVEASGHVEVNATGLQATGERLVYTAADRVSLLTGDKNAPPKAVDVQGTTTGAALRFRNSCEAGGGVSVEALGEIPGEPAQRVRTDARVSNPRKKEKGNGEKGSQ
jgi:lipopolysaccharide export system protein LptA